jgi:hypothetical protein
MDIHTRPILNRHRPCNPEIIVRSIPLAVELLPARSITQFSCDVQRVTTPTGPRTGQTLPDAELDHTVTGWRSVVANSSAGIGRANR